MTKYLAMALAAMCVLGKVAPSALGVDPPVMLVEDATSFTLANGHVTARIEKRQGVLASLKYKDLEMLGKASGRPFGYWSHDGGGALGNSKESAVLVDPAKNGGERAIVSCRFQRGEGGNLPADVDLRFALGRGDTGIYVYSIWAHKPDYPAFRLGEARYTLKLNEKVFDYLTIDARRRKVMPTPEDWDKGTRLNMMEARRMNTGLYKGQPEHKYDYSAIQFETPAFGWSSTQHNLGLWVVNPTIEYLGGGPTKVELTGHLDTSAGAAPTLCNYWVGSHYGGSAFRVAQGEAWSKVVGPMLIYCNTAAGHEALWKDALAKAKQEEATWPYDWVADAAYPTRAQRGSVAGQLTVKDPLVAMDKVSNLLVGLTGTEDWQKDAKSYQFWVRADKSGRFTIPKVRPGAYTLRAFADGVLGEFSQPNVVVTAAKTTELGNLEWKPVRHGRQLWEIGIPNRSAEEFRHGDHYWQWGLYLKYPEEFPSDVNFIIGKSDWKKDWNYCQPPRIDGNKVSPTTWSITFDLPEAPRGKATLRLAFAGSSGVGGIQVKINDQDAGNTGPLPNTGVMHRDGIRGYWFERDVAFDAALLKAGTNVLKLTNPARSWQQGVLYDYLRLELDEPPKAETRQPVAEEPPTDWIDPTTGHRVLRLSREPGSSSLYFHQNTYTPEGDKLVFDTRQGIAAVDLTTLGSKPPQVELIVPGARAIATARKTREVYYRKEGVLYAANLDTKVPREVTKARGNVLNADETILVATVNATDPTGKTPRPEPRKLLPQRERMFGDKLKQNLPLTPEEEASARKEDGLARRLSNPSCQAFVFTNLKTGEAKTVGYQYAWLNHLQFSPTDPTLLLYCHEGTWHEVDRIWTIRTDGSGQRLMHQRTMDMEIAGHEFWSHDGKTIWFDLQTPRSKEFWLASVNLETGAKVRYPIERDQWSIHYNVSRDGRLFAGDGGDPGQVAFAKDGRWIYLFTPVNGSLKPGKDGWLEGKLKVERLVNMTRHNYRLEPNVTITPDSKWVVFRSNMHGATHVYAVAVNKSAK